MKKIFSILILVACLLFPISLVYAEYVLPYPSYLPGNKIYRITRLVDTLKEYWSFGNLTKVKYRMGLADKYLVEAKTLMEYKQYLLGADALKRSDEQISQLMASYDSAKQQYGDLKELQMKISDEMEKHTEVLVLIQSLVPESFVWNPEKAPSTELKLADALNNSMTLRLEVFDFVNK